MRRDVEHHEYVNRPYKEICELLDQHGAALVGQASGAATMFATDLAGYLEKRLGFFDREERVNVITGPLIRSDRGASMTVQWEADPTKRFLPNVEATIEVNPLISAGASATSELGLRGTYSPPRERNRGLVEHMLASRLVDATLHTFLRHLADSLQQGHTVTT